MAAEVSSVGAGSGWVFFSGARVIAPTILSLFESLVGRVVLGAVAVQTEGGGRVYARRAAVLCSEECTPRDGLSPLPCAKGRAEGVVRACHARVVLGAWGALPRKSWQV